MKKLLLAIWLPACQPPKAGEEGGGEAETGDNLDAMVYSSEDPEALWTAEEMGEYLSELIALGAPNPIDITSAFRTIMTMGDEDCPNDIYNLSTIPEGCDTDAGYHYAGIGWYYASDWIETTDGGQIDISFSHGGDFEILYPDGKRFAGGGGMSYISERDGQTIVSEFEVHGSWVEQTRVDWLGVGFSGVYESTVTNYGGGDYAITMTGGIGVGDQHIYLDGATWDTTDACAGALSGAISVRDARGFWTEWKLGDDCDTCGSVTFHEDVDLGELCLDLTEWGQRLFALSTPR